MWLVTHTEVFELQASLKICLSQSKWKKPACPIQKIQIVWVKVKFALIRYQYHPFTNVQKFPHWTVHLIFPFRRQIDFFFLTPLFSLFTMLWVKTLKIKQYKVNKWTKLTNINNYNLCEISKNNKTYACMF